MKTPDQKNKTLDFYSPLSLIGFLRPKTKKPNDSVRPLKVRPAASVGKTRNALKLKKKGI